MIHTDKCRGDFHIVTYSEIEIGLRMHTVAHLIKKELGKRELVKTD